MAPLFQQPFMSGGFPSMNRAGVGGFNSLYGDTGLKAYWKFNAASGNIPNESIDASAIANSELVPNGATHGATGLIGDALSFDGTNDDAQADNSNLSDWDFLHTSGGSFSAVAWVYADNWTGNGAILSCFNADTAQNGFFLSVDSDGTVRVDISNNLSLVAEVSKNTSGTVGTGGWHMISTTFDDSANVLTVRIDNNTRETFSSLTSLNATGTTTAKFMVGALTVGAWWHDGLIDEVSLWGSRLLSTTEEESLYNSGAGLEIY